MVKTYNCLYSISIITVAINLYCANVLNVDSAKISRRLTEAPVRQDTTKEQSHANTPTTISIPRRRSREFLTQNPPWHVLHHENVNKLVQYKIKFDRPPHLKKLPESLIISPELRHLYRQTDRRTQNRDIDNT